MNAVASALADPVAVLAPTGQDAALIRDALTGADVRCEICPRLPQAIARVREGAAALLVAEEALDEAATRALADALARQEPWSDLPVLLLRAPRAEGGVSALYERLGNLTLVDRPTSIATLLSVVRAALRARARQYQMRATDRRKDEFIAMLSHELRNPLAPLTNAHRLLERSETLSEPGRRMLELAQRQTRQLTRLVDDLLEISRVSRGKIALHPRPMRLDASVADAVESVAPMVERRAQSVRVEHGDGPAWVHADPARIEQILENLLTNASKYSHDGATIVVRTSVVRRWIELRVEDPGIGIDPARIPEVFELFSQIDASLDRAEGGLGIGLALVRRLVEMHGGRVEAISAGRGLGSTFVVRLPRLRGR